MLVRSNYFSLIYKGIFIILGLAGLYLNSGLPPHIRWGVLSYYTIQSNIICLVFMMLAFIYVWRQTKHANRAYSYAPRFKGAVVFCITVTMLIYNFILAPMQFSMGKEDAVYSAANILVHYLVPLMLILDWVLFDFKGRFKWFDPFLWLAIPYLYFVFALIRAEYGGDIPGTASRYPYDFINVDKYGLRDVLVNVAILTVAFLPLGYFYFLLDRLLKKIPVTGDVD